MKFTIPLVPVSKKNSQRIVLAGTRYIPLPSQKYTDYERQAVFFIPRLREPINYPVNVKCLFYMPTKRRCDLTNMLEAIDDVMVKHRLLADDNYSIIVSHDGSRVLYDKENPRTEVYITRYENATA
ncbi:MAG: RusA family crossover junction endodeoxyribonuclease [Acutalibacteraceae bacterium]